MRPSFTVIHEKLVYLLEKYETELANERLNINSPTLSLNFSNINNIIGSQPSILHQTQQQQHTPLLLHSSNNFTIMSNSSDVLTNATPSPKLLTTFDFNRHKLIKQLSSKNSYDPTNKLDEKRLTRQSESDDSQYFSGTDMSNSLLYVDSSNFSTESSLHYSAYAAPPTEASMKAASIMATSLDKRPPSPPPLKPLTTLLSLASEAYKL